jgi:hypothetical protein
MVERGEVTLTPSTNGPRAADLMLAAARIDAEAASRRGVPLADLDKRGQAVSADPMQDQAEELGAGELVLEAAWLLARNPGPDDRDTATALVTKVRAPVPKPEIVARELVQAGNGASAGTSVLLNTIDKPDYVAAEASAVRLELASRAGALTIGLDLADTIEAQNSLEKMLAHQMAAAHRGAMNMMAQVDILARPSKLYPDRLAMDDGANVRAARLAGSAARLMASFQQGMTTLQQCRRGGKQEVHVLHQNVQVNEGGQAVIAGKVGGGGRRKSRAGGRTKK